MLYKNLQNLAFIAFLGIATACNTGKNSEAKEGETPKQEASSEAKQANEQQANTIPTNNSKSNTNLETAKIAFEQPIYDFGKINAGEKVNYKFKFKNTGKTPLIIQNATGSCGCTVPSFSKDPIAPDGSGEIAIVFDSAGKDGKQEKTVTVTANTEPTITTLTIKGEVKGKIDTKGPLANPNK